MRMIRKFAALIALGAFTAGLAGAQQFQPVETKNAALRYWWAFSLMKDPPALQPVQDLLANVAAGTADWDENRLGPILDSNREAIEVMQAATNLPECDWGIDYEKGPAAHIPPMAKARVLGNLNAVYGTRLAAGGDLSGAVDSWLAGMRFAKHVTRGSSLIGLLAGKSVLVANLNALDRTLAAGKLDEGLRAKVLAAVKAMLPDGFDWGEGMRYETYAGSLTLTELAQSSDPKTLYESFMGRSVPADFKAPDSEGIRRYNVLMEQGARLLEKPYAEAKAALPGVDAQLRAMGGLYAGITPNIMRVNEVRAEVIAEREKLLGDAAGR